MEKKRRRCTPTQQKRRRCHANSSICDKSKITPFDTDVMVYYFLFSTALRCCSVFHIFLFSFDLTCCSVFHLVCSVFHFLFSTALRQLFVTPNQYANSLICDKKRRRCTPTQQLPLIFNFNWPQTNFKIPRAYLCWEKFSLRWNTG